jgi:hypothetical protein
MGLPLALRPENRVINSPSIGRNYVVAAGAGMLVLIASLVSLLRFNGYSLVAVEVLPVYAGIVVLGAVLGALYLALGRLSWFAFDAFLVAIAVDLNSEGMIAPIVAWALTLAFAFWLRRSLLPFIGVMASVVILLSLAGFGGSGAKAQPPSPPALGTNDRPAIVHLLLDEHVGIEGLPAENAASPALRERLKAFYVDSGFRLYGRAYSEHMHTVNAVPQIMNLGENQQAQKKQRKEGVALARNAYFDGLRAEGYTLNVYQTDFVELCGSRTDVRCVTYPSAGLSNIAASTLSRSEKSSLIVFNLLALSDLAERVTRSLEGYRRLARVGGIEIPRIMLKERAKTSTIHSLTVTDQLVADLGKAQPGQAYVAHLLLPHYPYVTRPDCSLRPRSEWAYRRFSPPIREREKAYFDQLLCVTNKVSAVLAALEHSPAARNYIVIVHGDHGSRITVSDPVSTSKRIQDRDLIAGFSTLFAVKAFAIPAGYEAAPISAPLILKALAESDFARAPAPVEGTRPAVMLDDERWRPARRTVLPSNW